ncbi:hypothetical protein L1077_22230 [Pseudoalteromonas luteoviolacea]|uniref:hypothetical protein n=1 Tax=Pseudoalteromonas luteoviolacea TaxID=43657 RepID=UPI001F273E4B|nr:hypothetical protein [Pseudoalteromonas luteoviolacea]MCF6442147.1 hypothetical protein [Pseudoalteromonas luteoviolacea]
MRKSKFTETQIVGMIKEAEPYAVNMVFVKVQNRAGSIYSTPVQCSCLFLNELIN